MNKMMILFSLLLAVSLVFIGGRSFAEGTTCWGNFFSGAGFSGVGSCNGGTYPATTWERVTGALNPYAPSTPEPMEGTMESAQESSNYERVTGGLSAFDPSVSESMEATMEGPHEPSNWERAVGGLSSFAPYEGQ